MIVERRCYLCADAHAPNDLHPHTECTCLTCFPLPAEEVRRLLREREELSEIIDTWGFVWMEEREQRARELRRLREAWTILNADFKRRLAVQQEWDAQAVLEVWTEELLKAMGGV